MIVGISIPSKKNLFSDGEPPLTIISFRKPDDVATPGKFATTLEISLFPPALLEISEALIVRRLTGLAFVLLKVFPLTFTSPRISEFSLRKKSSLRFLLELTFISD